MLQKAGIAPGEDFDVERFTVVRYREGDPAREGDDAGVDETGEGGGPSTANA